MKSHLLRSGICLAAAVVTAGSVVCAFAADSSLIRLPMQNTGFDADASAVLSSALRPASSVVIVNAGRLTPGHSYSLRVGDRREVELSANREGRIVTSFTTTSRRGKPLLDFDPRGQRFALYDGTNAVLEGVASGPGEPSGITVNERARLTRLAGTGEATASYQVLRTGRRLFTVKLERVTGTNWSLYVNGIPRGPITVRGRQATLVFDSAPGNLNRPLLDFDPRGQLVDIAQDSALMFSGRLEAKARNVNVATPSLQVRFIPSTGAGADGTARAKLRVDPDARRKFSIEVEDVPAGGYELLVNGTPQGVINVVAGAGGTEGEIEFSSRQDDGDELPLNFDPSTSTFVIQAGGVVFFQGVLAVSSVATGVTNAPPAGGSDLAPDTFAGLTLNLDDQPGGDLMRFDTATVGVDLGVNPDPFTYALSRMNSSQVHVNVSMGDKLDAYVFTFTVQRAGRWTRDEYRDGIWKDRDTGPFTIVAGNPSSTPGGPSAPPVVVSINSPASFRESLTSTGLDADASGHADFEIDARSRRKFSVEIEDVPAGAYELWVGGVRRGSIAVTQVGAQFQGELEFASPTDDPGKVRLTFDPRGQLIEVKTAAGVFFSHLLGFGSSAGSGTNTGGNLIVPARSEVPLFNLGVSPVASAKAEFKRDDRGRRSFEVEIEDAPVGSYALWVGNSQVASIAVAAGLSGTHGEIQFEDDDSGNHPPLSFDPLGQIITISREGMNYFQREFPSIR